MLNQTRRLCIDALGHVHPLSRFAEHLLRTVSR
jgi:hypothetical protein